MRAHGAPFFAQLPQRQADGAQARRTGSCVDSAGAGRAARTTPPMPPPGTCQRLCEAVQRPNMRFVPVKKVDQQSRLMVHRARQGYVQARTATLNRIRGLLSEFGFVLP